MDYMEGLAKNLPRVLYVHGAGQEVIPVSPLCPLCSLSSIVCLSSLFLSCSLSSLNGSAIVPSSFSLSLSLLRTHQLSFGLGARPCQTSAAQHIPCVGCCRMARRFIHTMRRKK